MQLVKHNELDFNKVSLENFKSFLPEAVDIFKKEELVVKKRDMLDSVYKLKDVAKAIGAHEFLGHIGLTICLMEKHIIDTCPAMSPREKGALKAKNKVKKDVSPEATSFYEAFGKSTLSKMRSAYSCYDEDKINIISENLISSGFIPSRKFFLNASKQKQKEQNLKELVNKRNTKESKEKLKDITLHNVSIDEFIKKIPEESIDFIITNPPNHLKDINVYNQLALFANKVLMNGGSLLCFASKMHLPDILNNLISNSENNLKYHWIINYILNKNIPVNEESHKVFNHSKVILWFVKGDYKGEPISDNYRLDISGIDNTYNSKGLSIEGISKVIDNIAFPGQKICDPFMGAGTIALSSYKRGCAFVGSDINKEMVDITKGRLIQITEEQNIKRED